MCIILCFLIFSLFLAVKASKRNGVNSTKKVSVTTLFPIATLHGTISPGLLKIWEMQRHTLERRGESQSPPLYEKVLFL
jgi:condensin-2 complex subunit H2